jgi:integrase
MTERAMTTVQSGALAKAGQAADRVASRHVFADYRSRKATNTIRRQDADLSLFAEYLADAGVNTGDLAHEAQAWQGVTWGLVSGFMQWQLGRGYSVGSVNVRLSTVKTYCKLALKAGALDATAYAMIRAVEGYSHKEGKRIDERRTEAGLQTRNGHKKAGPVSLTCQQAEALKRQPDTAQGRRDALIMCLLLDHGLRVSEVAGLQVGDFDLAAGELRFYRQKVDLEQTHRLTPDTLKTARAYLGHDAPKSGPVLRGSRRDGRLHDQGMTTGAITTRVKTLGRGVGVTGLSAHDLRHHWATQAARNGTPLDGLMQAGGWASPGVAMRYVEASEIANEAVKLTST